MQLDVIIPTYNREELLGRTLASLLAAERPAGSEIRVTVVDNNSVDGTKDVVEEWKPRFEGRLNYLLETRQGKSQALNSGIAATSAELVAMIDDDEEVSSGWFIAIDEVFSRNDVDFIGGPYLPRWEAEPPVWLPRTHRGVIGWVENGSYFKPYTLDSETILMGGNAVIRRLILEKIGGYSTVLGPAEHRLLSCEDEDMYHRLMESSARGFYVPALVIYHFVPTARMTKPYHRQWCFWRGVSVGLMDRDRPANVTYLLGVPRYLFGNAVRGFIRAAVGFITAISESDRFAGELAVWDLAGFFYGKHFFKRRHSKETTSTPLSSSGTSSSHDGYLKRGVQ